MQWCPFAMVQPASLLSRVWKAYAPEHCHRKPAGNTIFMWPWIPLLVQSASFFHTPPRGPCWLLTDNAKPLRAAIATAFVPTLLHIALS